MGNKSHQYPKGTIINFTSGEYSDYGSHGIVVTIKDLDLPAIIQAYASGKDRYDSDADVSGLATHLVATGYAMPVDDEEVHLGTYGEFHSEFGVKYKEDDEE